MDGKLLEIGIRFGNLLSLHVSNQCNKYRELNTSENQWISDIVNVNVKHQTVSTQIPNTLCSNRAKALILTSSHNNESIRSDVR